MSIGKTIKELRLKIGMTQEELANEIGIKQPMLCQIERGTKIPTMVLGAEIAKALGCSYERLLED